MKQNKMTNIDLTRRGRYCKECDNKLRYNDERYELRKITFKPSKGISQKIAVHLCPTCAEILMQGLLGEGE